MGKRHNDLWPQVTSWENLVLAWRKARKGKRSKPPAATFELNAGENLLQLQKELQAKTYRPGNYHSFTIHEPKRRLISAAPFRDRVVHHALCNVIEPLFERRFIGDSYANRVGKGTHRALDRCQAFARRYRYILQCDVEQFFPAIDHAILREELAHVIGDPDVLWLIDRILESGAGVLGSMYEMRWFPGDDLLAALRPRGLPVGNLTSQFWANVYLDSLDQFVKRELRCPGYLRFVDDFLLFSDHKHLLRRWRSDVVEHLAGLRLTLHEARAQVRRTTEGIPFLGFIVYPTHRRLKRRKGIQYRRRFREMLQEYAVGMITFDQLNASVQGWINHARYGDTWGLRRALFTIHPIPKRTCSRAHIEVGGGADLTGLSKRFAVPNVYLKQVLGRNTGHFEDLSGLVPQVLHTPPVPLLRLDLSPTGCLSQARCHKRQKATDLSTVLRKFVAFFCSGRTLVRPSIAGESRPRSGEGAGLRSGASK